LDQKNMQQLWKDTWFAAPSIRVQPMRQQKKLQAEGQFPNRNFLC
jgi:hypothetical protein